MESGADGKAYTNSRIPFEIIQIGAVKLDENFSEISQFDRYIRPAVYTKLHDKVQEILNVTIEELTCIGHDFTDVANDFIRWCGNDSTTPVIDGVAEGEIYCEKVEFTVSDDNLTR